MHLQNGLTILFVLLNELLRSCLHSNSQLAFEIILREKGSDGSFETFYLRRITICFSMKIKFADSKMLIDFTLIVQGNLIDCKRFMFFNNYAFSIFQFVFKLKISQHCNCSYKILHKYYPLCKTYEIIFETLLLITVSRFTNDKRVPRGLMRSVFPGSFYPSEISLRN